MCIGNKGASEVIDIVIVVCWWAYSIEASSPLKVVTHLPSRQRAIDHANPDSTRFFRRERLP